MFKVTRNEYPGKFWLAPDLSIVQYAEFNGADTGESITITLVDVSEEQLEAAHSIQSLVRRCGYALDSRNT